jgi:hypothetical protein
MTMQRQQWRTLENGVEVVGASSVERILASVRFEADLPDPRRQVQVCASKGGGELSRTDLWLGFRSHNVAFQP